MNFTQVIYHGERGVEIETSQSVSLVLADKNQLPLICDRVWNYVVGIYSDKTNAEISALVNGGRRTFFKRVDGKMVKEPTPEEKKLWPTAQRVVVVIGKRKPQKELKKLFRAAPVDSMDSFLKSNYPHLDPPVKSEFKTDASRFLDYTELSDHDLHEFFSRAGNTSHGNVSELAQQCESAKIRVQKRKAEYNEAADEAYAAARKYALAIKETINNF